jgi:hypothetical protein
MTFQHQVVVTGERPEDRTLTIHVPGQDPITVLGDNPNFDKAVEVANTGNPETDTEKLVGLTVPEEGLKLRFRSLSDRLVLRDGIVYFDGDEIHNTWTKHLIRCLSLDGDWEPLVKFYENVQANPRAQSREELYDYLQAEEFSITEDGFIIGYKSVNDNPNGDGYVSTRAGYAIVDGEEINGPVPNKVGSIVEYPRSKVDPSRSSCSTGLHVGTFAYTEWFNRGGTVLKVIVNPRDVVSTPGGSSQYSEKMRVCRYVVDSVIEKKIDAPIVRDKPKGKVRKAVDKLKSTVKGEKPKPKRKTRDELRREAAKLNIRGRGDMNRDQLEQAVNNDPIGKLNRDGLRKEAARLNIPGRGKMNRDQLLDAVVAKKRPKR